jgi:hypothetical protein
VSSVLEALGRSKQVINKLCVGLLVVADPRGYAKNMTKRGSGQVPCGSKGRNSARLGSEVNRGQGAPAI